MPVEYTYKGTKYTIYITYVDIDTGQVITSKDAHNKHKYIIIKHKGNETRQYSPGKAHCKVERTTECRKQPQQTLRFE